MYSVALNGMKFFARHGFYEQELLTGGYFEVDIKFSFNRPIPESDELSDTTDYQQIYEICHEIMKQQFKLIEKIAAEIRNATVHKFPEADIIHITVRKHHPPISGNVNFAEISLNHNRL